LPGGSFLPVALRAFYFWVEYFRCLFRIEKM
jgi:hypothetical protein